MAIIGRANLRKPHKVEIEGCEAYIHIAKRRYNELLHKMGKGVLRVLKLVLYLYM